MTLWRTYYHIVWSTRDRLPFITDIIESDLYGYVEAKSKSLGCLLHAIGGMPDHVHLVVSIPPKLSISSFVKHIKGGSSRHIETTFSDIGFAWQREYGVFSLGSKQLPEAISYVKNQKCHHGAQTLIPSLEQSGIKLPCPPES